MTDEDRVTKLEKQLQDFTLVTRGVDLQVKAPKINNLESLSDRIAQLESAHKNFRIVGGANTTVEGSLQKGFAVCSTCPEGPAGTGTVGVGPPPPPLDQVCYNITFSATVSGTAIWIGLACGGCSPTPISADTVEVLTSAFCCDSGDPVVGGCTECDCVYNLGSTTLIIDPCGTLCIADPHPFNAYVELDNVGGDYQLTVQGSIALNSGDPPDCAGVCAITNDTPQISDLGADPTGSYTVDFVGDNTGATYHFEITITAP